MNRRTAHHLRAGVVVARADYAHLQQFAGSPVVYEAIARMLMRQGGPHGTVASQSYALALDRLIRNARKLTTTTRQDRTAR